KTDGAVLPIVHVNGYKISGPTIFGTMSEEELRKYFEGLGYEPIFVDQYTSTNIYVDFLKAMVDAHEKIHQIKKEWNENGSKPKWPVIIFKNKKGWTCPEFVEGIKIEDHNNSHGIPLENPKGNETELRALDQWLRSYK